MPTQVYKRVPIDSITEHPENDNKGDEASIDQSMEVNGWYGACVYQKSTGWIIAGNHRHRVAKRRGDTEIDAFELDCDDATALRILLFDNETTRRGSTNKEHTAKVLRMLADANQGLEGTGYDLHWLVEVEEGRESPVALEDVPEFDTWESKYGVIVECGSEGEQELTFETLKEMGMACRVVTA